jgi:hypothetical protein
MTAFWNCRSFPIGLLLAVLLVPTTLLARNNHSKRRDVRVIRSGNVQVVVPAPSLYPSRRPPGWDRGRKTGWGACSMPPGQAKKFGCNPIRFFGELVRPSRRPVLIIRLP